MITSKRLAMAFPKLSPAELNQIMKAVRRASSTLDGNDVEYALELCNRLAGQFGVEVIDVDGEAKLLYVNTGDTYKPTLCFDLEAKEFFVGSWGDWVEEFERWENEDMDEAEEDEDEGEND